MTVFRKMSERKVFLPVLWHVRRRNWCVIGSCGLAVGFGGCTFPLTGVDELQGIRRDGELDLAVAVFCPSTVKLTMFPRQGPCVLW